MRHSHIHAYAYETKRLPYIHTHTHTRRIVHVRMCACVFILCTQREQVAKGRKKRERKTSTVDLLWTCFYCFEGTKKTWFTLKTLNLWRQFIGPILLSSTVLGGIQQVYRSPEHKNTHTHIRKIIRIRENMRTSGRAGGHCKAYSF